jgi:hypothetical protein
VEVRLAPPAVPLDAPPAPEDVAPELLVDSALTQRSERHVRPWRQRCWGAHWHFSAPGEHIDPLVTLTLETSPPAPEARGFGVVDLQLMTSAPRRRSADE